MEDLPLEVNRHGFVEETHFTVAYSPVPSVRLDRAGGGGEASAAVYSREASDAR